MEGNFVHNHLKVLYSVSSSVLRPYSNDGVGDQL